MAKVLVQIANEKVSKCSYKTAIETVKEFNKLHNVEMFSIQETNTDVLAIHLETETTTHPYLMCCLFGQAYQSNLQINRL